MEQGSFCNQCDEDLCLECDFNYYLLNGDCQVCNINNVHHCNQCAANGRCAECDYTIADLDENGYCTLCKTENGFVPDETGTKCICAEGYFADTILNICRTCDELIPGCNECALTDNPQVTDAYTFVGYDEHISNG